MAAGITHEKAVELLHQYVKKEGMINHSLASEAVLGALARHLGRDEELWSIAGLLHDIDVEITNAEPTKHGLEAVAILEQNGVHKDIVDAIKMHNEMATGQPRTTEFQHALAAGETITGLIVATTLVYPDKKIASIKTKSVTKRMKEKAFAASVNRDTIMECEQLGIPVEKFAEIAIAAMTVIAAEIGL
ncbi:MAG: HDIG domain-containing metalloprotein [Bacteroidota bacterium]